MQFIYNVSIEKKKTNLLQEWKSSH